jgi:hypothetical protein
MTVRTVVEAKTLAALVDGADVVAA